MPEEVPGIVFLSGGMTDEEATSRLNEINRRGGASVGRSRSPTDVRCSAAAQGVGRRRANVEAAQAALAHRARMNGLARNGEWSSAMEDSAA